MEQQYLTRLADAYRRGYEIRYQGAENAPEMKMHYFKRKEDLPRVQVVLEEKIDGANSAISFTDDGELRLQSRGHFLTGGGREKHYDLMKQWAAVQRDRLHSVLGSRYIMYGEWMYAKHFIGHHIF